MLLNKKWEKVTLEKTKDTGIIYLDAKELKSPEGRSLNLPYSISEKVFIEWKEVKDKIYPDKMPLDTDNDLLVVGDSITPAVGEVSHLSGTVLTVKGQPVKNALVEIWQVGAKGVYIHTKDNRPGGVENFKGYGRFLTDSKGRYYCRTVKPVTYPGRAPHIHVAVTVKNKRMLTSQCYINGDKRNEKDFIYKRLGKAGQKLTSVNFKPIKGTKTNELDAVWDIIIGLTPED